MSEQDKEVGRNGEGPQAGTQRSEAGNLEPRTMAGSVAVPRVLLAPAAPVRRPVVRALLDHAATLATGLATLAGIALAVFGAKSLVEYFEAHPVALAIFGILLGLVVAYGFGRFIRRTEW